MKKKSDFITNSSSCSFVAWGINIEKEDLIKKYGRKLFEIYKRKQDEKKHKKALKQGAFMTVPSKESKEKIEEEYNKFLIDLDDDLLWIIENLVDDLEVSTMPYEETIMLGKSPFDQKSDQTLEDFKNEICEKFKSFGLELKPNDLDQIEECWMDN